MLEGETMESLQLLVMAIGVVEDGNQVKIIG